MFLRLLLPITDAGTVVFHSTGRGRHARTAWGYQRRFLDFSLSLQLTDKHFHWLTSLLVLIRLRSANTTLSFDACCLVSRQQCIQSALTIYGQQARTTDSRSTRFQRHDNWRRYSWRRCYEEYDDVGGGIPTTWNDSLYTCTFKPQRRDNLKTWSGANRITLRASADHLRGISY